MKKLIVSLLSVFITQSVCADLYTNDISGGCNSYATFRAVFAIKSITCLPGYFLPANSVSCATCPSGYTCNGGTYEFNENEFQGANYSGYVTNDMNGICGANYPFVFKAKYSPRTIGCTNGKYLVANSVDCNTNCPANYYCPGGNYTFSESENSGIYPCQSGTYSPIGSGVCYPHILHVGDNNIYLRSTKLTTPSVNIKIGNDIFYANMTTTPTFMNKSSIRYLRVKYNNTDYYVCDDTTCPE